MILIVAAILPAILLWLYTCRKDAQPEPMSQMLKAFLYGALICIPVSFVENYISGTLFASEGSPSNLIGSTLEAFIVAAVPEEGFKLLALWLILRHNPFFDEHYDGIVYAVCVGLGFAAVENVGYVLMHVDAWLSVAVTRALLAVPGHYAFAVFMGYYYSLYHFGQKSAKNLLSIFFIPVLAHGCYDAFALTGTVEPVLGGISFILLIYFCIKMHKNARQKITVQVERDRRERAA
ncbi:MAG: PrsW family intramembrane metalloprotease [Bacteroidaceae bacterium]|nr:PrsW family intramembrane metalloprotease [Bacteroidaceae bacterium]